VVTDLDDYTPGAGGAADLDPLESALSSLPLCDTTTDAGTCLEPLRLVEGTIYRVVCAAGHERFAHSGEPDAIAGAEAAYERRGGRPMVRRDVSPDALVRDGRNCEGGGLPGGLPANWWRTR
jgi:hypothetical protein